LEILVALVVLGFLMIGLTQGVHYGLVAWGAQQRMIASYGDMDAVDRALRRLVEHMYPGTYADAPQVIGTAHRMSFTTDLPFAGSAVAGQRADVELLVDTDHRLLLRWTLHVHAVRLGPPPVPDQTELMRNVDRLELSYLPRPNTKRGSGVSAPAWTSIWDQQVLPALVRIHLVPNGARAKRWPDIIAAPMNEQPE
jgi:general secretion pathway protein J